MVVVVSFLTLLVQVAPVSAQFAETTGTIQGTIRDATGGVIPGAEVGLSGETAAAGRTLTTDRVGYFRFAQLTAGKYTLTVTAAGFKKYIEKDILLDTGKRLTFEIEMQVGEVAAIVEVTSAPENIDVTASRSQVTVTTSQINIAPKPRLVLDLVQWAPGARAEPASAAGGFQIDGASASENQYTVEGQDTTQIRTGVAGVNPPPDFFKEVQVKSSGFEAEHGGAMGGLVNLLVKGGGPEWHGAGIFYFRHSGLNAAPRHFNRLDPSVSLGSVPPRHSEPVEDYNEIEDRERIFEPGFELGGPVWRDRIFLYTSYIPRLNKSSRTVIGTNSNSLGPRDWTRTQNTHFAVARLDGRITNNLRAFALWDYAYSRTQGTDRPSADDLDGKTNASASVDANTRRSDRGQTLPNVLWRMGGDWTPTSKIVVAGAYGKWFEGLQDRGVPTGIRHFFASSSNNVVGLDGTAVPASFQQPSGFSDIPSNFQFLFDHYARTQGNIDGSIVVHGLGTHTFKGGWSINRLSNDVRQTYNSVITIVEWDEDLTVTAPFAAGCAPVIAFNQTTYGVAECRGNYGNWYIQDFQRRGAVSSNNHGFYFQDSWNMGYGVTINAGVRFEREFLPSFAGPGTGNPAAVPVVSKPIEFPFSDKVSPRLGGAWDVFRNGKLKVFASWGWFYDIMKYEMPRGSFGGDYWHNCWFTLDTFDFTTIQPTLTNGFNCNNGATGALPGTFLGEEDLRIPSNTAANIDNVVDPGLQPARQTETVIGAEWAFTREIGINFRWSHRRLRNAIEDAGILGALGETFLIVNPGERIGEFPLRGDCAITSADPRFGQCDSVYGISSLPAMPKATREYDAVEIRANKRFTGNWYANVSYTWSRLYGNYSGLASSDEDLAQRVAGVGTTGGGRTSPNVNRMFDEQEITWNSFGEAEFGRLQTDRPHTFKAFGAYRFKYWGMESIFGVNQAWFMGTPRGSRMYFNDLDIPVYVWGRSTFANLSQNPTNGAWILDSLEDDKRTPQFSQTDFTFTHTFNLSKTNEALKLEFQFNALNLWNQGGIITFKDRIERSRISDVTRYAPDTSNRGPDGIAGTADDLPFITHSHLQRNLFFNGFDPIAVVNNNTPLNAGLDGIVGTADDVSFGTSRLDQLYGLEARNQFPRELRLSLRVLF